MPRPLEHGPEWDTKDARSLTKILERVATDDAKDAGRKEQIEHHLKAAINLLLGSRTDGGARKAVGR